jgi:hypothetical protein
MMITKLDEFLVKKLKRFDEEIVEVENQAVLETWGRDTVKVFPRPHLPHTPAIPGEPKPNNQFCRIIVLKP